MKLPNQQILAERKISQSLALEPGQILKLRKMAEETGKSVSRLAREAVTEYLLEENQP